MRWNLAVAALAASWGFIAIIVAHVDLAAEVLVFYRLAIAAATVALALALARRLDLARPPGWAGLSVGAVLAAHWFLFFETIKRASVAVALVTVYTGPLFLAILAPFFLAEARSRIALAALAPAGAGIALIALGGGETRASAAAVGLGLGAAVTYAFAVIAAKRLRARLPVTTILVWNYGFAALLLAPFLAGSRVLPQGGEIGYVLLLGAVFTALSGLIYVWLLGHVTAQSVGVLSYLEPVAAALLAWAILGQAVGWNVVAGGVLVLGAGLLVVLREPQDAAPVEAPR